MHLPAIQTLAAEMGSDVAIVAVIFGCIVAITAIIAEAVRKVKIARAKEESRREIAAYVAEGTIKPDDAVKILDAGGAVSEVGKVISSIAGRS